MTAVHGWVYDWQTLLTGLLALLAGLLTGLGTILAANRQIKAVKAAADRQVAAARHQAEAAHHQTTAIRNIEHRRITSERLAFGTMLKAAMIAVIEDVAAARNLPQPEPLQTQTHSDRAYEIRQRVRRTGFMELRGAFVHFGGSLTEQFLRLDSEIEGFARAHTLVSRGATAGPFWAKRALGSQRRDRRSPWPD